MLLINLLGLLLMALVVWWFWLYKPRETVAGQDAVTVIVDNGVYQPPRIRLPAGKNATLRFLRKDASPCAAMVVFSGLDISEELPLNKPKEVNLPPLTAGEYSFTCQMQMYRGDLIVTNGDEEHV